MVNLIIRPNRRIEKDLLLESIQHYNVKCDKPVNLRILGVGIKDVEVKQGTCHYIDLYLEIRHNNFKCKAYSMRDGILNKEKVEIVTASWETIKIRYKLIKHGHNRAGDKALFKFETDHQLFNLINYAFQQNETVPKGNKQGIQNVTMENIKFALVNLDIKVIVEELNGKRVLKPVHEYIKGDVKQ